LEHLSGNDQEAWNAEYKLNVKEVANIFVTGLEGIEQEVANAFLPHGHIRDDKWDSLKDEERWALGLDDDAEEDESDEPDFVWEEGHVIYCDDEEDTWYAYDPSENQWYKEENGCGKMTRIKMPEETWVEPMLNWAKSHSQTVGVDV